MVGNGQGVQAPLTALPGGSMKANDTPKQERIGSTGGGSETARILKKAILRECFPEEFDD